jgi:hypothetical protein
MAPEHLESIELAAVRPLLQSMVKSDIAQVRNQVAEINRLLKSGDAVALRICECCIQVTEPNPGGTVER